MGNILGNETILPDRKKPTLLMSCLLNLTNTILISLVSAVSYLFLCQGGAQRGPGLSGEGRPQGT